MAHIMKNNCLYLHPEELSYCPMYHNITCFECSIPEKAHEDIPFVEIDDKAKEQSDIVSTILTKLNQWKAHYKDIEATIKATICISDMVIEKYTQHLQQFNTRDIIENAKKGNKPKILEMFQIHKQIPKKLPEELETCLSQATQCKESVTHLLTLLNSFQFLQESKSIVKKGYGDNLNIFINDPKKITVGMQPSDEICGRCHKGVAVVKQLCQACHESENKTKCYYYKRLCRKCKKEIFDSKGDMCSECSKTIENKCGNDVKINQEIANAIAKRKCTKCSNILPNFSKSLCSNCDQAIGNTSKSVYISSTALCLNCSKNHATLNSKFCTSCLEQMKKCNNLRLSEEIKSTYIANSKINKDDEEIKESIQTSFPNSSVVSKRVENRIAAPMTTSLYMRKDRTNSAAPVKKASQYKMASSIKKHNHYAL